MRSVIHFGNWPVEGGGRRYFGSMRHSVHSYEEITTLSKKLEKMRVHINQLLKQIKEEQDAKQPMEIALLQEQINPHFLYIYADTRSASCVN